MTDHTGLDFERQLERRLTRYAAIDVPNVDAERIASQSVRHGRLQPVRRSLRGAVASVSPSFAWRSTGSPALRLAVVAALLLLAAAATLWLVAGGIPRRPSLVDVAPSPTLQPLDVALTGAWLADAGRIAELGNTDPRLRLVIEQDGRAMHLEIGSAGVAVMHGTTELDVAGSFVVASDSAGLGCHVGDAGRYALARAADGVTISLTTIADGCASRAAALPRTWWRSLDAASMGGRGVVAPFGPGLVVTLPSGSHQGTTYAGAIEVAGTDGNAFYAIKDPWGLSQPCSTTGGPPVELPIDLAAYTAYVDGLPGFAVASAALTIGGHPAVHLAVTSDAGIDCPGGVVIEWIAKADAPAGVTWHLGPGDPDSLYLVELPDTILLLQYLGPSVTTDDELQVMSSIQFVDGLAGAP